VAALDVAAVPPRFRRLVDDAIAAQSRWRSLVSGLRPGPIRDRLELLGEQVGVGVLQIHATAVRVGEMERTVAALDPDDAADAYKRAKRAAADGQDPPELPALEARFTSVQRILNKLDDTEQRLTVLDARLDAAIARGAEVALTASEADAVDLGEDLEAVVDELSALRAGLDAVA